ncbi:hypothetical protein SLEP1_g1881 [Rubroshorea leprosula]|uniref:RING-type E3 ubiquitin transferase n=1 Tax=Rubroshorea leprosula TaxID=152421 RepID=A0AAV5HF97_9ROSI|nr:hypothetical protein SLEP1_g1881 [Rubroshorea leprosula]
MDEYSGKRAVEGLVVPRKGAGLILKETVNNKERNAQICSRIGCSSRLNSVKGTQIGSEKAKSTRPSYRSLSSGKEIIGSSSRTCAAVNSARKSSINPPKKLSSHLETDSLESSSVQDEPEVSELIHSPGKIHRRLHAESEDANSSEAAVVEAGSSSIASNSRSRRNFHQRSGLGNQDSLASSSASLASRSTSQPMRGNGSRYGLKNLRCNSISDVVPSGCSSSDSNNSKRKDVINKRNSDGESSSSSRGKKISGSLLERRNNSSTHNISASDSRRARNWPLIRDSAVASVRTRRPSSSYGRMRLPNQGNGNTNSLSSHESTAIIPQAPQSEISLDLNAPISAETALSHVSSFNCPGGSSENLHNVMPSSPSRVGITRSVMNRDGFRRYNMDGIAEVLLALERIEQDEELTYEQLVVLETSLLLNGLNFYDQHRDMRLDIDNMSYEELLALEERMGSVSTALPEEALSKCLTTSIYESAPEEDATIDCGGDKDDTKCSICQEEYVAGDEVGSLQCEHRYHVTCIRQWLRLKNWCPICKASAEPSPSSSSSWEFN